MPLTTAHLLLALAASASLASCTQVPLLKDHTVHHPHDAKTKAPALIAPSHAPADSTPIDGSYLSISLDPAFWNEFFGRNKQPNTFTMDMLANVVNRTGVPPYIRPGGNTQDSTSFDPKSNGTAERVTGADGTVYSTTYGRGYYESWVNNFPSDWKFISTLDLANQSLEIAVEEAVASVKYAGADKIAWFELGNEPNLYKNQPWGEGEAGTEAYVAQWLNWTGTIDRAVNAVPGAKKSLPKRRWWVSSPTPLSTTPPVGPEKIIPAGIDRNGQVAQYNPHGYQYLSCDPASSAKSTIPNILNITALQGYATHNFAASTQAAASDGRPWIMGEANSVACEGKPNVTDTFAQALFTTAQEMTYTTMGASRFFLHQGATLSRPGENTTNKPTPDGTPSFSAYSLLYPVDSESRGKHRVNPGFVSQLFMAEAFGKHGKTRFARLEAPQGIDPARFFGVAVYDEHSSKKGPSRLLLMNTTPYSVNSTEPAGNWSLDVSGLIHPAQKKVVAKRMTAPYVDELDTAKVTWAGQSFKNAKPHGKEVIETVADGVVKLRDSEGLLVFLRGKPYSA